MVTIPDKHTILVDGKRYPVAEGTDANDAWLTTYRKRKEAKSKREGEE